MSLCVGFDDTSYGSSIINNFKNVDYLKINLAFHSEEKIKEILEVANKNNIKVILDCKIGDIERTQKAYLKKYKGFYGVTVNPLMGFDVIKPFMNSNLKPFVLLMTSNKSREDFEEIIYHRILTKIVEWIKLGYEINIVLGATVEEEIFKEIISYLYINLDYYLPKILIPGIGTQGGNIKNILEIVVSVTKGEYLKNLIFSNSSQIMKSTKPLEEIEKMNLELNK
jgi:orotidine-5'-phosphate decarboxylase